jgi:hypothetical protein
MADRYTQVVILCEDMMHLSFVRRYLIHRGIEARRIRGIVSPAGRGAGSQYVLKNYPVEVKSLRSRPHVRAGLLAVIDADASSVDDRLRQLEQSLAHDGQPGREDTERIGLLAPKRNVETWIFHLVGNEANEEDDYKKRVSPSDLKESVDAFAVMCPARTDTIPLPSLNRACKELTAFIDRGR